MAGEVGGSEGGRAGGSEGGGEGGRQIPGAGPHFVSAWQRQFDVDKERGRAEERGQRIEDDTLFAFALDRRRESAGRQQLAALQHAVRELAATPLTEALRRSEPVGLGRLASASLHAKHEPAGTAAPAWRPWARGTAAHAALLRLVAGTAHAEAEAEHGGACESQPQAAATPEPRAIGPAEAAALEQEGGAPAAKRARMAAT